VIAAYAMALWGIALVFAVTWRPRVRLDVHHSERVCVGEVLPVDVDVRVDGVRGNTDLYVVAHRLPAGIDAVERAGVAVPRRAGRLVSRVRLGLRCSRRGAFVLQGFRVESSFPFALIRARRTFDRRRALLVYPRFTRLARLVLPAGYRYQPGGVALASNLGESCEYIGNREYRQGDSVRNIDWRATARLIRPIVREYREEYFMRVGVVLDTHVPGRARPKIKAAVRADFERAVSVSAAVSDYMARQEYLVDLFAAGPNLYHLTAGRSLAYLDQILHILACVDECATEPFDVIEPQIMEDLSRITTVICVMLDWDEARRAFVHRLTQAGSGVKVIVVRDREPTLPLIAEADVLGRIAHVTAQYYERGVEEL
jgi:uncharacterized protein (DUF58 family)